MIIQEARINRYFEKKFHKNIALYVLELIIFGKIVKDVVGAVKEAIIRSIVHGDHIEKMGKLFILLGRDIQMHLRVNHGEKIFC